MLEVFRKEIKYSISTVQFYRMKPMLQACLTLDPHCADGAGYQVRSLYFDSYSDGDLFDVLAGVQSKQKIRLRTYDAAADAFKLEYKCKTGTDSIKKSIAVSRSLAMQLAAGRYEKLAQIPGDTARELYARMKMEAYQPRVVVYYRRIAYIARLNDVRITFDYDIGASFDPAALFTDSLLFEPVGETGAGVLEVKYNQFLPGYLETALCGLNALPTANSKYAQSRLLL